MSEKTKEVKVVKTTSKKKKKAVKKIEKKKELITVQSPINPEMSFVIASELADDEIIEAEILGTIAETYIYKFQDKTTGKEQTGLSVIGTREVNRRLNRNPKSGYKIRLKSDTLVINRDIEYDGRKGVEVSIFAEDLLSGMGGWGIKFEPYYKERKDGKGMYFNRFALEIALSKAERNAIRKLIPESLAIAMIKKLMSENKNVVKTISAPKMIEKVTKSVSAPKPSSGDTVYGLFVKAVAKCKTTKELKEMSENLSKTKKYNDEMKKKVFTLIAERYQQLGEK